jgi:hypothetical protein
MSLALIRKELREHGVVVLVALAFGAIAYAGGLVQADKHGGRFFAFTRYAGAFGSLNALVLANRLFAREYAGRTQLFLETLPLSRTRVFVTKWLLGFGVVAIATFAAWLAALLLAQRREVIDVRAALDVLACGGLFALAMWAWSAMAGMLGRYRFVAWFAAFLLAFIADTVAGIKLADLPVIRLLGEDVAMARAMPSTQELLQAAALVVVSSAAAAALALVGSGAIASTLAQRMTARERAFIWVSFIAALVVASTLKHKPTNPPFTLRYAEHVDGAASVSVLPIPELTSDAAHALAARIAADVRALRDALALPKPPPIAIIPQRGLDPTVIQRAQLDDSDGIVLRVAPDAPQAALRAHVLHAVLVAATHGRAVREDRHVLLDGISNYLVLEAEARERERYLLRAAAIPSPVDAATLVRWDETSERLGNCLSGALAFVVVDGLAEQLGRSRLVSLMRELFHEPHDDVRVLLEPTPSQRLSEVGSWPALAARTDTLLRATRLKNAAVLARRPQVRARFITSASPTRGRKVEAELFGVDSYWVGYTLLGPWTKQTDQLSRIDARSPRIVLPLSPPHGSSLLAAIELDDAVLECPVRVLAQRLRLP